MKAIINTETNEIIGYVQTVHDLELFKDIPDTCIINVKTCSCCNGSGVMREA